MRFSLRIAVILWIGLLATTGCFGGGEAEADVAGVAAEEPAGEAQNGGEPSSVPAEPPPSATEAAAPATDTAEATADARTAGLPFITIDQADAIASYRVRITTSSETVRGTDEVVINGAVQKTPPALQFMMEVQEGDQLQQIGFAQAGDAGYLWTGDAWMQSPGAKFNLGELTVITPDQVTGLYDQLERIGEETLNQRSAVHYRAAQNALPVFQSGSDVMDLSQISAAELHLWIDQEENFLTRLLLTASDEGNGEVGQFAVNYEYYDFNQPLAFDFPQDGAAPAPSANAPAGNQEAPRTDLGRLLGFDLLLPTGSDIQTFIEGTLFVVAAPYTLEEGQRWIEVNLPHNGYTLLDKSGDAGTDIVYVYQKESKVLTISLSDNGDGRTLFQFAAGG